MDERTGTRFWSAISPLRLRRITTTGAYVPEIEGLRFIAVLAVVLFHVPVQIALRSSAAHPKSSFWIVISHGARGVPLFFVISGFILALPFASCILKRSQPVRLPHYYLRRLTRLEPPYIVAILIRIPLLILSLHKPMRVVLEHGFASLFYIHSVVFGYISTVNPPSWSLEVEIQFYCLAPLIAFTYFKLKSAWVRRTLASAFIFTAGVLQAYIVPLNPRIELSIVYHLQYFFAGALLVDLYLTDWDRIPSGWAWDLISTCAWAWIFASQSLHLHLLLPFVIVVAYIGAFKGRIFSSFFRLTWITLIGGMCYSIYLTHGLAITAVDWLVHHWLVSAALPDLGQSLLAYSASIVLAFIAGLLMYVTIERPCMDKNWPTKLKNFLKAHSTGLSLNTFVNTRTHCCPVRSRTESAD